MIEPPDFEALYRDDPDPWRVGTRWYEQRKLGIVAATLRRPHYRRAWDPACGTGHLARRLASRADEVLASDAAAGAVDLTRRTCEGLDTVVTMVHALPEPAPHGELFDLIVLAEFLYYLPDAARRAALATVCASAGPDAEVLAVHWRHRPHDAHLGGAETQAEIVASFRSAGWRHPVHHEEDDFVLDVVERGTEPSVRGAS